MLPGYHTVYQMRRLTELFKHTAAIQHTYTLGLGMYRWKFVHLRIAKHWCGIYYMGQKQICFKCHMEGHLVAKCPSLHKDKQPETLNVDPSPTVVDPLAVTNSA